MKITDFKTFVVGNPPPGFGGKYFIFVKLTADDVSSFAFEISGKGRDPAEVAKEWVEKNPKRVDAWLGL